VHEALDDQSPGQPLAQAEQHRLGSGFEAVRVHADSNAGRLADGIDANAFTRGSHIYFAPGHYSARLLRHELVHVSQQAGGDLATYPEWVVPDTHTTEARARIGAAPPPPLPTSIASAPVIQREPKGTPPPPRPPALSPDEMWKLVLNKRGMESRVPPHAVEAAKEREEDAHNRLAEAKTRHLDAVRERRKDTDPDASAGRAERARTRDERSDARTAANQATKAARSAETNASEPAPPDIEGPPAANRQQLGHGTQTFGAIQVTDDSGHRIALGVDSYRGGHHAEENSLAQIRHELTSEGIQAKDKPGKGWHVTIVVDQVVCPDRCRPALRQFAQDYGINPDNVVAHYPERTGGDDVTPKTASRSAHVNPTRVGAGERVLSTTPPPASDGGGGGGGKAPDTSTANRTAVEQDDTMVNRNTKVAKQSPPITSADESSAKATKAKPPTKASDEATTEAKARGKGTSTVKPEVAQESSRPKTLTESVVHNATNSINAVMSRFSSDLMSSARANVQDKDVSDMLDTVDHVMDTHALLSDPNGFAVKIKTELVNGVFRHFAESLASDEAKYVARFPEPTSFRNDPLGGGVSLSQYRAYYQTAKAAYMTARVDQKRQLVALGYQLQHSDMTRLEQTEAIKTFLAGKGNISGLERKYDEAKFRYAVALTAVDNHFSDARADLATQSKGFSAGLHRRGVALGKAGRECDNFSQQLIYFAIFPPAEMASLDFKQLADGFNGLSRQFEYFATMTEGRKQLYDAEAPRIKSESDQLEADHN
jgi:hypothetical protein